MPSSVVEYNIANSSSSSFRNRSLPLQLQQVKATGIEQIVLNRKRRRSSSKKMFIFLSILVASLATGHSQYAGGCPESYGVQTYPDEKYCDKFYKVIHSLKIILQEACVKFSRYYVKWYLRVTKYLISTSFKSKSRYRCPPACRRIEQAERVLTQLAQFSIFNFQGVKAPKIKNWEISQEQAILKDSQASFRPSASLSACSPTNLHFQCVNGTLYEEVCENGLVYGGGHGAVYNFCNYNWATDCGSRLYDDTPISSPGCLYQYGLYPVGEGCQTTFYKVCI